MKIKKKKESSLNLINNNIIFNMSYLIFKIKKHKADVEHETGEGTGGWIT